MTTGNSGFLEVEPLTEGDTTPPSLQMISLSDGANSNASMRCASAIPGRKDQMSDDYGREGSWVEDALISVNAMLYPLSRRSGGVRALRVRQNSHARARSGYEGHPNDTPCQIEWTHIGPGGNHSRIREHIRYVRISHARRELPEPPLRLPLVCIRSPDLLVAIQAEDVHPHHRVRRDDELGDRPSVSALNWGAEREDRVLFRPVDVISACKQRERQIRTLLGRGGRRGTSGWSRARRLRGMGGSCRHHSRNLPACAPCLLWRRAAPVEALPELPGAVPVPRLRV